MDITESVKAFLEEGHFMVLATLNSEGAPHQTIVWHEFKDGVFKISTVTDRVKYKNVMRNKNVSILIYHKENPYKYFSGSGKVTDITRDGAHEFIDHLSEIYTGAARYHGDPDWKQDRVNITIKLEKYFSVGL